MSVRIPSPSEVARAIYLDLEGKAPSQSSEEFPSTLAGWRCEGEYHLVAFEEQFLEATQKKGGEVVPRAEFMSWMTSKATREGRRIIYWTSKESDEFGAAGFDLGELGFDLAVPMRKIMKPIFKDYRAANRELRTATSDAARRRARKRAHGLCVRCAEEVGLEVPRTYGWGKVGDWIRLCESMNGREYADWRQSAKKAWWKLIAHNRLDCEAMEMLAKHHAKDD